MGLFSGKAPQGVGCYGKLPLHGDYVSHLSDGAEARRLTAWLDEGYRLTGGQDDRDAAEAWFFLPGRKKTALAGVLWPSADASGTRRFPFGLFAVVSLKRLIPLGPLLPLGLAPIWMNMIAAHPPLTEATGPEEIRTLLEEISVPGAPEEEAVQEGYVRESAETSLSSKLAPALLDLCRLAGALLSAKKGAAPAFAIRIPLLSPGKPEVQAAAWLGLLSRRLGAPGMAPGTPLFIRPPKGESIGECFLFHRELRSEDLGFILDPKEDYPYANLLGDSEDGEGNDSFRTWLEERLGDPPCLADLDSLDLSEAPTDGPPEQGD